MRAKLFVGITAFCVLLAAGMATAQQAPKLLTKDWKFKQAAKAINQRITITAVTGNWEERPPRFYYRLYDTSKDWILVRVQNKSDLPDAGRTVQVTGEFALLNGELGIDRETGKPVFRQETRTAVNGAPISIPTPSSDNLSQLVVGAAVVVLIAIVSVLVWQLVGRGGHKPVPVPAGPGASSSQMTSEKTIDMSEVSYLDAKTIVVPQASEEALQNHTIQVIPGRLEVTAGEDRSLEIPLYRTRDNLSKEWLLGRVENSKPNVANKIAFRDGTVSRNQSRIRVDDDDRWHLTNLADGNGNNRTALNGVPMETGSERVLSDGDTITFGRVELKYHAR